MVAEIVENAEEKEIKEAISTHDTSIQRLLDRSEEIASQCTDYVVKRANIDNFRMNDLGGIRFRSEDGEVHNLSLNDYSLSQLGTKIGVPARYIDKCVKSGRIDLAQDNVNSWMEDYNKDLFIREYNGRARGILSSKYSVCDTPDILKVVDDAVDLSRYKIKGSFLNEERLHVRLVGRDMLNIEGEDLFPGIFIDSSDVGRSILTVRFGIYKQVCTNGLVIAKAGGVLFEQKHIGITSEEFHEGLVSSLKNVDTLTENAEEWIKFAKKRPCHWSAVSEYDDDIKEFINYIREKTNLSEESATKVITLMRDKYEDNRWGLINGITEVAQDFTLERRLELEKIAGNLLVA